MTTEQIAQQEEERRLLAKYIGRPTMFSHTKFSTNEAYQQETLPRYESSLDELNIVWVKVYAEAKEIISKREDPVFGMQMWSDHFEDLYHDAINYGNISAALSATAEAIRWLQSQTKK